MSELDANIIVDGQKVIATSVQSGTVIEDGGVIDATAIIQTDNGPQKVVKTYDINGGGGGGGDGAIKDYEAPSYTTNTTLFASPLFIPNLDALTEAGTYRVHFGMEIEGTETTVTYIADVAPIKMSGTLSAYMQNLYVGPGGGDSVSIIRSGVLNGNSITWTDWSGNSLADISTKLSAKLENTATGINSLTILGTAVSSINGVNIGIESETAQGSVAVGWHAQAKQPNAVAVGSYINVNNPTGVAIGNGCAINASSGTYMIALGTEAKVTADHAIQIGRGTNSTANTVQVYTYPMLDGTTGLIPAARLGTGFDATKTQVLKNVQGVLTWVDEA